MFNVDFPTDTTEIKFRAAQWICTEVLLILAVLLNLLPRKQNFPFVPPSSSHLLVARLFKWIVRFFTALILTDFLLNIIWLQLVHITRVELEQHTRYS